MARKNTPEVSVDEDLSRAIIALYMAEPFFAHVLHGMARRLDASTPMAAVAMTSTGVELRVNPAFFAGLAREERVAVIKHEVLHVVLKHLLRFEGREPLIWNLACDVVVNALIGRWRLPKGAVTRATFPELPIPLDATAEEVYALLRKLGSSLPQSDAKYVGGHSDHSAWGAPPDSTKGDVTETEAAASRVLNETLVDGLLTRAADRTDARNYGLLPGAVQRAVVAARERAKPKVDWRRSLRLFASGTGRTRLKTTTRRESTRYGNTALPGAHVDPRAPADARIVPGTKIVRQHTLLVAVDTSGSIDAVTLEAFANEIHGIWRAGATVYVVICDAAIQQHFEYRGAFPVHIGGGGGTAFEPVFAWMRQERARRFDGLIYLTDGCGPQPTTAPTCKVLWVVTTTQGMGEHLRFGRQILLG